MRLFLGISAMAALIACSPDTPSAPEAIVEAQTAAVTDPTDPASVGGRPETPPAAPIVPEKRNLEDIDFTAYSQDLAKYTGLKVGQSRIEAIDQVRLYFAPENADTILQTSSSQFDREDGSVLLYSAEGFADDAIKGEEIYLILSGPKGEQKLAAYGSRIKCWRGENTTDWQTEACP